MIILEKYRRLFLVILLTSVLCDIPQVRAELPPKAKAFLIVSAYGAAGGALLGFASMAFGSNGRAIAQGASLGLYGGMIFGAYILITHEYQKDYSQGYQDADTIYNDEGDPYDGGFFDAPRRIESQREYHSQFKVKYRAQNRPLIYSPIINISF